MIKNKLAETLDHYGDDYASSGQLYLTNVCGADEGSRNRIITKMAERGVAANVHYKPLPMHTAYKNLGFDIKDYLQAFMRYANELTLPLHTLLTDDAAEYVAEVYSNAVKELL